MEHTVYYSWVLMYVTEHLVFYILLPAHGVQGDGVGVGGLNHLQDRALAGLNLAGGGLWLCGH